MPRWQSSRMFESDFMEWFSHVHPSAPFILYVPVVVACLLYASSQVTAASVIPFYLVGIFAWSLLEYFLHRFVFHMKPQSAYGKRVAYIIHDVHHIYPHEGDRLVMPPMESIPFAILLILVHWVSGGPLGLAHFAGLATGYLYYDFVHFSVHTGRHHLGWFPFQKRNHMLHHFKDEGRRFGVSTPLWDWVFGTL